MEVSEPDQNWGRISSVKTSMINHISGAIGNFEYFQANF